MAAVERLDAVRTTQAVRAVTGIRRPGCSLDELLDSFPAELLRPARAHMSLRMVDWAIRHFTAADVEHWLSLAEARL